MCGALFGTNSVVVYALPCRDELEVVGVWHTDFEITGSSNPKEPGAPVAYDVIPIDIKNIKKTNFMRLTATD